MQAVHAVVAGEDQLAVAGRDHGRVVHDLELDDLLGGGGCGPFDAEGLRGVGGEDVAVGADREPGCGVCGAGGDEVAFGVEDRVGGEPAAGRGVAQSSQLVPSDW